MVQEIDVHRTDRNPSPCVMADDDGTIPNINMGITGCNIEMTPRVAGFFIGIEFCFCAGI